MDETRLRGLGARRAALREELDDVTGQLKALVLAELAAGRVTEAEAARLVGVDRMTMRVWQGKPRSRKS